DQRQVTHLTAGGSIVETFGGFSGPIGISVDSRAGRIWVADAVAGAVVALDRRGNRLLRVGGLPTVREVAVDLATGDAWATVPGAGQLVVIASDGTIRSRASGLAQP